jgi:hypothetical protein
MSKEVNDIYPNLIKIANKEIINFLFANNYLLMSQQIER